MSIGRYRPAWLSFRRFAAFTTALTLTLIMLGVYTAATGSGLACSAQWPLCDNGLLPQTIPSFIEWFHRLVAMITGFFILGTALWAWRAPLGRGTTLAATLAVLLLPLQISIGAVTVTLNGMLPAGYSPPTQAAHLLVALSIFTALVVTTLRAFAAHHDRPPLVRAESALLAALVTLPVVVLFSRVPGVLPYAPDAQAAFIGTSLALYASLVAVHSWVRVTAPRIRLLTDPALVSVFGAMLLGRDILIYSPAVRLLNVALFAVAAVTIAGAALLVRRRSDDHADARGGVLSH